MRGQECPRSFEHRGDSGIVFAKACFGCKLMTMETFMGVLIGIGLAAACGFRVFVPLLVVSIATNAGYITLSPGFEWIGSQPVLIALVVATVLEVLAYSIPWLDNLLDTLATPAAVVAGTVIAAAFITGMDPWLQWALSVIAGGGAAAVIQGMTVMLRGSSTLTTGGVANPAIAAAETGGAMTASALALLAPVLAVFLICFFFGLGTWFLTKRRAATIIKKTSP